MKGSYVLIKSFCVFCAGCGILSKMTTTYFLLMAVALKLGRLSTVYPSTKLKARHPINSADLLNVNGREPFVSICKRRHSFILKCHLPMFVD